MAAVREIIDDTYVYFYSTREEAQALAACRATKLRQPSQPFEVPKYGWLVRCPDGIYDDHGKLSDELVDDCFLSFFRDIRPEDQEECP